MNLNCYWSSSSQGWKRAHSPHQWLPSTGQRIYKYSLVKTNQSNKWTNKQTTTSGRLPTRAATTWFTLGKFSVLYHGSSSLCRGQNNKLTGTVIRTTTPCSQSLTVALIPSIPASTWHVSIFLTPWQEKGELQLNISLFWAKEPMGRFCQRLTIPIPCCSWRKWQPVGSGTVRWTWDKTFFITWLPGLYSKGGNMVAFWIPKSQCQFDNPQKA